MKHLTATGQATIATDPNRLIWYSSNCSFWTDDWGQIAKVGGIPCCPTCQAPGFQTTAQEWEFGISTYDKVKPGYSVWLNGLKGCCHGRAVTIKDLWQQHLKDI